jgi:hypothetical protein
MATELLSVRTPRHNIARISNEQSKNTEESKMKKEDMPSPSADAPMRNANDEHARNRKTESTMIRYQRPERLWLSRRLVVGTVTPMTRQADTMHRGLRLQHPQEARVALCLYALYKLKGQPLPLPDTARRPQRRPEQMDHRLMVSSSLLPPIRHLLLGSLQVQALTRNSPLLTKSSLSMSLRSNPLARRRITTSRLRLHLRRRSRVRRPRRLA